MQLKAAAVKQLSNSKPAEVWRVLEREEARSIR
jgi:hypothetical protein